MNDGITLRATFLPFSSTRKPVSIAWRIVMRTSIGSPRRTSGGSCKRAKAIASGPVDARGERHGDVGVRGVERVIGHRRDGDHSLGAGETHARLDLDARRR